MKPIKYKVLEVEQLSAADKIVVSVKAATIFTGQEALANSFCNQGEGKWVNENWQYQILDRLGRVGILKYKGAEVALYFQRNVIEVEPLPVDPIPDGVIRTPTDAWLQIQLLGLSARQISSKMTKENRELVDQLQATERELTAKCQLFDSIETSLFDANQVIAQRDETIKRLRAKISGDNKLEPWERANNQGERPGGICCQRAIGGRCFEHNPKNYRKSPVKKKQLVRIPAGSKRRR